MQNILNFMQAICAAEDIYLDSLPDLERLGGVAIKASDDIRAVVYSDKLTGWSQISTIAHELGHHALGHFDDDAYLCKNISDKNPEIERREREAQIFAAAFTAFAMYDHYKELGGVTL